MKQILITLFFSLFILNFAIADDYFGGRNIRSGKQFVQNREVFFNDTYFFGQNGFFDVGDNARVRNLEAAYHNLRRKNEALEEQLDSLEKRIKELNNRMGNFGNIGGGDEGIIDPLPPGIPPIIPSEPPDSQSDKKVSILFNQKCSKCHAEGKAKGGLSLITKTGDMSPLTDSDLRAIRTRTVLSDIQLRELDLKSMPLGGPRLSVAEKQLIDNWVNERISG